MTLLRGYAAFLAFTGQDIEARVLSYSQMGPILVREGDWAMDYQFQFEGRTFTGHATFAPKRRPSPASSIRVRFFPFAPSVSSPAEYISTSALGGYLMSAWAFFAGARFLRRARSEPTTQNPALNFDERFNFAAKVPTIEELALINPEQAEEPPGRTGVMAQEEAEKFRTTVESVLGPVRWNGSAGAEISQASCSIPAEAKAVPANEFMGINLSNFGRLFVISYEWDMKPEKLDQLVGALSAAGFRYIPFTLFADPQNCRREHMDAMARTGQASSDFRMKHEDVFNSLFGYA
jgi:hypothetical protein